MAAWVAALLFAAGGSAWLYNILMRQTGNNTQTSLILSGIAFTFMFVLFWTAIDFAAELASK